MKNTRKRVITFESRSQSIIYRRGVRYEIRCAACGSDSVCILPEGTDEERLRRFELKLRSGECVNDACQGFFEADTLPQF